MIPPADGSKARPIIVLGYQRSGTSLMGEIVHRWGADAGPDELLMPADRFNPQGYWEYKPLLPLYRTIADFADHPDPTITYFTIDQEAVLGSSRSPEIAEQGSRLVARMEESRLPWMWKDPALACFLPYWLHFWESPIFIVTVRNPQDSALSWQEMLLPGLEPDLAAVGAWMVQWQRCMILILMNTHDHPRLFVEYERLLDQPYSEIQRVASFLAAHTGAGGNRSPHLADLASIVTQRQARHRNSSRGAGIREPTQHQLDLYHQLQELAHDRGIDACAVDYPLPGRWIHLLRSKERAVLTELGIS